MSSGTPGHPSSRCRISPTADGIIYLFQSSRGELLLAKKVVYASGLIAADAKQVFTVSRQQLAASHSRFFHRKRARHRIHIEEIGSVP